MRLSTFVLFNLAMTLVFFCIGYHNLVSSTMFSMFTYNNMGITTTDGNLTEMEDQTPSTIQISSNETSSDGSPLGLVQKIAGSIFSDTNIAGAFLLLVGFSVVGYLSGFSANFLVPALIVIILMNILFFPFGAIMDPTLPMLLKFFFFAVYNTFTIISTIDFIRGGM